MYRAAAQLLDGQEQDLLNEIAGTRPKNRVRKKVEKLPDIRITLREKDNPFAGRRAKKR